MSFSDVPLAVGKIIAFRDGSGFVQSTGFLISDKGHIVTTAHSITGTTGHQIVFGKDMIELEVLDIDQELDVALLKTKTSVPIISLKFAPKGTRTADEIYIFGFPLGAEASNGGPLLSEGDIQYTSDGTGIYMSVLIAPGSSGSPILNEDNEVIGVVLSMVVTDEGKFLAYGRRYNTIVERFKNIRNK